MQAHTIFLSKPFIGARDKQSVMRVLSSGHLVQGHVVSKFEELFQKTCGTRYAIAVSNGTAALHTALIAAGIGPGDEVITTPFTFIATANAIRMCGAVPVFADILEDTFNLDPASIEAVISQKTRAIIVVNLYGQPADYEKILKIARKRGLIVIEDAAQSIGAFYKQTPSGNCGDIGCFSLYATKNIISGEGGMITTNNKKYAEASRLFRNHGQAENTQYQYVGLGYNYRLTDLLAGIGLEQLKRLQKVTKKRAAIAKRYNSALKNIKGLITPFVSPHVTHVYHQYTLRITPEFSMTRDELQAFLLSRGIQSKVYYPYPLYRFKHLSDPRPDPSAYPVTEKMVHEVLSIPVHPQLTSSEVQYIINTIRNI